MTYEEKVSATKRYHRRRHQWRRARHLTCLAVTVGSGVVALYAGSVGAVSTCALAAVVCAAGLATFVLGRILPH